jgi:proline-rich protein PRCC
LVGAARVYSTLRLIVFAGSSSSAPRRPPAVTAAPPVASSSAPTVSSAPQIEDFTPPEPKADDPYPGYYQLPSGTWAAHDPAYYQAHYTKWKRAYDAHVRALERGAKGFEAYDAERAQEVDGEAERARARVEVQEREERKALTTGAQGEPAAPRMNVQGAKLGKQARSRHQLTTLLTEAYSNREMLEERIAQGKRNRKEAGMKYGGCRRVLLRLHADAYTGTIQGSERCLCPWGVGAWRCIQ